MSSSMDPDPSSPTPRKVKFAPKKPPRRTSERTNPKIETAAQNDSDDEEAQKLLSRKAKDHISKLGSKTEKKSSVQVAFSHENSSSTLRTFGKQKEKINEGSDANKPEGKLITSQSTPEIEELSSENSMDLSDDLGVKKKKKEYIEPWDYENSYYPTTLPWRMPNSGDPEILDEAEMEPEEYDENTLNSASELGLLEQKDAPEMMFFQFPPNLPLEKGSSLADLPNGHIGKMLVYKSGAVKLKMGNALFDVSPGIESVFAQNVAAINTTDKHFCVLGDVKKKVIVTPDIEMM